MRSDVGEYPPDARPRVTVTQMVQAKCGRCTGDAPVLFEVEFKRWASGKETVMVSRPVRIPDNQVAPKRFRSGPLVVMDRNTRQLHIADFNPNAEGSAARTIRERVQGKLTETVCPRCHSPIQLPKRAKLLGRAREALNDKRHTIYLGLGGHPSRVHRAGAAVRGSSG